MEAAWTNQIFEDIVETIREPLLVLNQGLRVVAANRSFYECFKVKPEETVGRFIYDLSNKQWDIPRLRELLETILSQETSFDNYEVELDFDAIGRRAFLLNARRIARPIGKEGTILLAIEDATERKRLENLLADSEERYRRLFETADDGIVLLEKGEGKITHANPATEKMLGYSREESIGNRLQDIGISLDLGHFQTTMKNLNKSGIVKYDDVPAKNKAGQHIDTDIYLVDRARLVQCNIRDITERKKADAVIRLQAAIIEDSPVIAAYHDKDLNMVWANRAYLKATGLSLEEVRGRKCYQIWNLSKPCRGCPVITAIETGESAAHELTPDNQDHWPETQGYWLSQAVPVRDEQGAVIGALEFAIDITERMRGEDALREGLERLEFALQGGELGMWDWNPQDGAVVYSDLWAQMLEYRPDEVEPTVEFFKQHVHPEDLAAVLDRLTGHVEGRLPVYESEHRLRTKSGRFLWVMDRGKIVERDKDGSPVRVTGFIADITERKQAEETLQQSEKKFRTLFENSPQAIALTDIKTGRLLDVNETFCRLTKYARSELIGKTTTELEFYSEDDRSRFVSELKTQGKVNGMEMAFRISDGSNINSRMFASYIEIQEQLYVLTSFLDMTELNRVEDQLRQAQKMESVGRLAGGVAHDFNNKLTVMMGYTQMVMGDLDRGDPTYGNLQEVMKAGEQSIAIVRQLLAFARKQIISPMVLDLNETVEVMLKMLRRLIGEDIDLVWLPGHDLWRVKMDPTQIDQILANLCVNARDAISGVGKVTIETENVVLDESYCADRAGFLPGDYVMVGVSDNGCGMDKETLANAFEPFFTTKEVGKGTGLGLATVYGIVKQNQGFVNIYSEPNKGTTFKIYLPRHSEEAQEKPEAVPTEIPRGRGETVLVVEDDAPVLGLARRTLEKLGYAVITSANPAEAIAMAREHDGEIHLLITDVVLPEMSGKDLAGEISKIRPDIQILYMSGYTANVIAHQGVLDEGVQFIGKPFGPDGLARKVRAALEVGSEK